MLAIESKVSARYFVGFLIGGVVGVSFAKSSWPIGVLLVTATLVNIIWHWFALNDLPA